MFCYKSYLDLKQPDIQLVWTVAIQAGAAHTFSCAGSAHDDTFMPAFDLLKVNKVSKRLHWSSSNSVHVPRSRQVKQAPTQQGTNLTHQRGVQQKN